MAEKKVVRKELAQYYGIGSTPTYTLMNTGFVKLSEENSPQMDNVAFVGNANGSPSVVGYDNKWAYEAQYIAGNVICDDLADIARSQKTGSDCERVLVDVDLNKEDGTTAGSYYARKFIVSVEATGPNGDPKQITKLTGNLHQIGDVVEGLFALSGKTFSTTAYTPKA